MSAEDHIEERRRKPTREKNKSKELEGGVEVVVGGVCEGVGWGRNEEDFSVRCSICLVGHMILSQG